LQATLNKHVDGVRNAAAAAHVQLQNLIVILLGLLWD